MTDLVPNPADWRWRIKRTGLNLAEFATKAEVSMFTLYSKNPNYLTILKVETELAKLEYKNEP